MPATKKSLKHNVTMTSLGNIVNLRATKFTIDTCSDLGFRKKMRLLNSL